MTSRIASAILTRTSSMRRSKLSGLGKSIHVPFSNDGSYVSNDYIHKDFYDDENYQSILKCLDDGYYVCMELVEFMEDYDGLLQAFAKSLTSYSAKWKGKLRDQSALSSYNTTKRAQYQTVGSAAKLAQLIQTRCEAIQQVIASYQRQIDRMYPGERLNPIRKHYRTDVMKKLFKTARSPLSKASNKLDELHEQEKKAKNALLTAQIECQNLELNGTTTTKKLSKANEHLEKREGELRTITEKLTRVEDNYQQEGKTYRQEATRIYQECRELEEERLNSIRNTLISFIQAIHTTEYSTDQDSLYTKLLAKIESDQSTLDDLDFWARTYHVNILDRSISSESSENSQNENNQSQVTTPKPNKSHKNETATLTTINEKTNRPVVDTEEDQSAADKPITSAKGKQKKKKNNATEPTTPEINQEQ